MSDEPAPGAQHAATSRAGRTGAVALIGLGLVAVAAIVTVDVWKPGADPSPLEVAVPVAIAGLSAVTTLFVARAIRRESELPVRQSHERVRAAEQGLEKALRFQVIEVNSGTIQEPSSEGSTSNVPGSEGRVDRARDGIRPSRLALSELWAVTHSRLDLYHEIATTQASRSFRNAQAAMVLGFGLLVIFVIVALQASTTAGAVVAGGLGAVAAALAGYVSRTFVRSQEAAASHLRAYFDQPLEFSRYLAAERLVADSNLSDEQRAEVVTELAKAMIAGPSAPVGDTANGSNGDAGNARA